MTHLEAAARPDRRMPSVGDVGPPVVHVLTLTDLVRYAGASGDFHPLHHDLVAAQAMGMPDVIGHGMFSAGLLARAITDFVGVGRLRRLRFRFVNPTELGESLSTSVTVVAATMVDSDSECNVALDCSLLNSHGVVKVVAHAEARFEFTKTGR